MLYDVVRLRTAGRRRLRVDVLTDVPVRGDVITHDTGSRYGLVAEPRLAGAVHWRLERCQLERIASSSLVLSGVDVNDDRRHTQEWWCRQPIGGPPQAYDPDPPSAVTRDPSYAM